MVRIDIMNKHGHAELQVAEQDVASVEVKEHTYQVNLAEAERQFKELLARGYSAIEYMTDTPSTEAGLPTNELNPNANTVIMRFPMVGG